MAPLLRSISIFCLQCSDLREENGVDGLLDLLGRRKEELENHIKNQTMEQGFKLKQAAWAAQEVEHAQELLAEINRAILNVAT